MSLFVSYNLCIAVWIFREIFSRYFSTWDSKGAKACRIFCGSRKMLQNAYLDAKIGFDTEENEPHKVWGELFMIHYSLFIRLLSLRRISAGRRTRPRMRASSVRTARSSRRTRAPSSYQSSQFLSKINSAKSTHCFYFYFRLALYVYVQ